LLADMAGQAPLPDIDGEAFVRRVMAGAAASSPEVAERRHGTSPGGRLRLAVAAGVLATAAGFWLFRGQAPVEPVEIATNDSRGVPGRFVARGSAEAVPVSAEALLVQDQRLLPLEGRSLNPSAVLAVRVTNTSGVTVNLMAFARDAAGEIHWLYPAYQDPRDNPASVAIETGTRGRLMPEVVQPVSPAAGPMRVVTLMLESPLRVHDIERQLAGRAADTDLKDLFASAVVKTWSASWEEAR
jgi:hypothetical protein